MQEARVDEEFHEAERWNRELKRIDLELSLVWVGEQPFSSQVAERFHIRKRVPGGLDGYIPLPPRPLGPWLLDTLREADMWDERVRGEKRTREGKIEEAKRRALALEEEQSEDEARLAVRAAKRLRGDSGMQVRTDLKRARERP